MSDLRHALAPLAVFAHAFDAGAPMDGIVEVQSTPRGAELFLTEDGAQVAAGLVVAVIAVRDALPPEEWSTKRMLTLVAAGFATECDGPIPDGEVAAAAAGVLEDLWRAAVERARAAA